MDEISTLKDIFIPFFSALFGGAIGLAVSLYINRKNNFHISKCNYIQQISIVLVKVQEKSKMLSPMFLGEMNEQLKEMAYSFKDNFSELNTLAHIAYIWLDKKNANSIKNLVDNYGKTFGYYNIHNLPKGKTKNDIIQEMLNSLQDNLKQTEAMFEDAFKVLSNEARG